MKDTLKLITALLGIGVLFVAVIGAIMYAYVLVTANVAVHVLEKMGNTVVQTCEDGRVINVRDKCVTE